MRPKDGRYGENPYRLQHYYQYQVLLKPSPHDVQERLPRVAARRSASTRPRTTRASSRTTGRRRRSARGAPAGRCGSTAWRSRSSPTSSRPAASTARPDLRRDHLRPRAARDVPAGRGLRLRPAVGAGRHVRRRLPASERQFSTYNFEAADVDMLLRHFDDHEREAQRPDRPRAAAAGLRPGAEVLARLQPARRARRHLGHRARRLHRPRPQPGARRRRRPTWSRWSPRDATC